MAFTVRTLTGSRVIMLSIACFVASPSLPLSASEALNKGAHTTIEQGSAMQKQLKDLTNFKIDTPTLISSGLPTEKHFNDLKSMGLSHVIDLIPGDRSDEAKLLESMGMPYYNVAVEWENPTLQNFLDYVSYMKKAELSQGLVLTHCKLNWRGAVFTYLYRVTQLHHDDAIAKQHMHETWKPNKRWSQFIQVVESHYANL